MNDDVRAIIEWCSTLEQHHRDQGYELLEPLPDWRSLPIEPLTCRERWRATRWAGAIAITVSGIVGDTLILAAGMDYVAVLVAFAVSYAVAGFLGRRAIERAYERKCNSLRA
jgi:hypothetical protein